MSTDRIPASLKRAGYTLGEWTAGATHVVEMSRDGILHQVTGRSHEDAWRRALRLAQSSGISVEEVEHP